MLKQPYRQKYLLLFHAIVSYILVNGTRGQGLRKTLGIMTWGIAFLRMMYSFNGPLVDLCNNQLT